MVEVTVLNCHTDKIYNRTKVDVRLGNRRYDTATTCTTRHRLLYENKNALIISIGAKVGQVSVKVVAYARSLPLFQTAGQSLLGDRLIHIDSSC